jgi:hypothetical protein
MMSNARPYRFAPQALLVVAIAFGLAACTSAVDKIPESLGGIPGHIPQRPAVAPAPINVYGVPASRDVKPLSSDEQKKLESELTTLREGQNKLLSPAPPPPPPPPPPAAVTPASKSPANKSAAKKTDTKAAPAAKKSAEPMKLN